MTAGTGVRTPVSGVVVPTPASGASDAGGAGQVVPAPGLWIAHTCTPVWVSPLKTLSPMIRWDALSPSLGVSPRGPPVLIWYLHHPLTKSLGSVVFDQP